MIPRDLRVWRRRQRQRWPRTAATSLSFQLQSGCLTSRRCCEKWESPTAEPGWVSLPPCRPSILISNVILTLTEVEGEEPVQPAASAQVLCTIRRAEHYQYRVLTSVLHSSQTRGLLGGEHGAGRSRMYCR